MILLGGSRLTLLSKMNQLWFKHFGLDWNKTGYHIIKHHVQFQRLMKANNITVRKIHILDDDTDDNDDV